MKINMGSKFPINCRLIKDFKDNIHSVTDCATYTVSLCNGGRYMFVAQCSCPKCQNDVITHIVYIPTIEGLVEYFQPIKTIYIKETHVTTI